MCSFFKNITQNFGSVTEVYGEDNITLSETFAVSGVFGLSWNPALIYESVTPDSAPILNIFARAPKLPRQYSLNYFGRPEYSFLTFGNDTGGCFDHPVITTVPILFDEKTSSLNFQLDSFIFQDVKMGSDLIRIDMGYPVLHFPDSVFNLIYQKLNLDFDYDHEIYTTSCSNKGQFADFVYTINGVNLTATSQNYILDLGLGQDICAVGISNLVSPPVPYVLGLPFLRDYCVKFDIDNTLIEFKLSDDA
ncbi:hypothetical protein M3Y94_00043100 [Aphelenchoides besseyi]|nr:hypothetical protein M3Y94_00043100 [Aphelenchoides besseyi]